MYAAPMFGDDHDGPPLHVPPEALRKPKGAEIGDDGKVTCISCGQRFPLAAVDIVGQGYRCAPCTHQAHVASLDRGGANVDAGAHLSRGAREELRKQGTTMQLGGVALIVVGIAIFIAGISSDAGTKLGGIVAAGGAGLMITGSMKKSAAGG
jgi:hypothetical protein